MKKYPLTSGAFGHLNPETKAGAELLVTVAPAVEVVPGETALNSGLTEVIFLNGDEDET